MDTIDLFPDTVEIHNGHISHIGGCSLKELASKYGTPLYIYDAVTFAWNYRYLHDLLADTYPGNFDIAYASKAYLSLPFARKLANLETSIDVASISELEIVLKAGIPPCRIHLHGNNKSEAEIHKAIDMQIESIVVDSLDELHFVEEISRKMNRIPAIWLRITPDITVDTHKAVQTGHSASKFGIPVGNGEAEEAIKLGLSSDAVRLTGLHTHLGSQLFDSDRYSEAINILFNLCHKTDWQPEIISPGGGWGVPYTTGSPDTDPSDWIVVISHTVQNCCEKYQIKLPKIIIEPGRWLVAKAGVSIYSVGSTKSLPTGEWIAAVDGGMSDNPRPALYDAHYSAVVIGNSADRPVVPTRLVGRFCESGDELIHQIDLPRLERGDIVAIPVSGAYQLSMSSNYNLADRPCVLWLDNGKVEVMQKREKASQSNWWLGE